MASDELEFVEWLRGQRRDHPAVKLGIGDDMAIVEALPGRILVSSDMILDGVHFDTGCQSLSQIGRKAIACSLSDCAAMAVRPVAATVSVALPTANPLTDAQELFRGMFAIADEYELAIAGGDTTRWDHPLAIDVAITAIPYDGIEPVTRSGAKPGDTLYVTGYLGGSLLGRHLGFTPRVREARTLADRLGERLHAMIDISDGLALDLWRMCRASNVGATLVERQLEPVISDDAKRAAIADGNTPLDHALGDGEDFELLLAVDGDVADTGLTLHPVGQVTGGDLLLRRTGGGIEPLEPKGYVP
ncbi:MAG: thiamine-phosphate kinase [Phycisphaerae bacterium]